MGDVTVGSIVQLTQDRNVVIDAVKKRLSPAEAMRTSAKLLVMDDKLISALQSELSAVRKKLEDAEEDAKHSKHERDVLGDALRREEQTVDSLRTELARVRKGSVRADVLSRWFDSALERTRKSTPYGSAVDFERVGAWFWRVLCARATRPPQGEEEGR